MSKRNNLLIIAGPTATGKSEIAFKIAQEKDSVIINADSKQVYSEIPIITAQPNISNDDTIHKLYGYMSIKSHYSVKLWLQDVIKEIEDAWTKNKKAIIVGGTGMYIHSLLNGFSYTNINPQLRIKLENKLRKIGNKKFYTMLCARKVNLKNIEINDSYRLIRAAENFLSQNNTIQKTEIIQNATFYVLMPERSKIYSNINKRFLNMLKLGVIDEIKSLQNNLNNNTPAIKACGVIEILRYLNGSTSISNAITNAQQNTRNYAKRQITWFRNHTKNATFFDSIKGLLHSYITN